MRHSLALIAAVLASALAAVPAEAGPTPPLSHHGRWFLDDRGRVVLLHGVNMVYKVDPYRPATSGFGADDARFLRRHGFNAVRLGIIYKGLEPRPPGADRKPRYSGPYLRSIARTERVLARRRIFSLLDFHQDLYNERFQGEGWPDWQTLDDGLPAEPKNGFPANYFGMPALNRAFDHFWANDPVAARGLQDSFAAAWRTVARRFRSRPYVVGYDILNEPWPGSAFFSQGCGNPEGCPVFDSTTLTDFSRRVIAAIRAVDRSTLVFWEPLVTFDFGAQTSHGDTGDPNAGLSFHDYCLGAVLGGEANADACRPAEGLVFDNADAVTKRTGDVPFLTEFGATDDLAAIERIVELADQHLTSWQYWHYCACDDPTTQGPGVQSLVIDARKPPRGKNVKRHKLAVLERPYPQAVAGTPRELAFDPDSGNFELHYSTRTPEGFRLPRDDESEVYVPRIHYRDGYRVRALGAEVTSKPGAPLLELQRKPGAKEVRVSVSPR